MKPLHHLTLLALLLVATVLPTRPASAELFPCDIPDSSQYWTNDGWDILLPIAMRIKSLTPYDGGLLAIEEGWMLSLEQRVRATWLSAEAGVGPIHTPALPGEGAKADLRDGQLLLATIRTPLEARPDGRTTTLRWVVTDIHDPELTRSGGLDLISGVALGPGELETGDGDQEAYEHLLIAAMLGPHGEMVFIEEEALGEDGYRQFAWTIEPDGTVTRTALDPLPEGLFDRDARMWIEDDGMIIHGALRELVENTDWTIDLATGAVHYKAGLTLTEDEADGLFGFLNGRGWEIQWDASPSGGAEGQHYSLAYDTDVTITPRYYFLWLNGAAYQAYSLHGLVEAGLPEMPDGDWVFTIHTLDENVVNTKLLIVAPPYGEHQELRLIPITFDPRLGSAIVGEPVIYPLGEDCRMDFVSDARLLGNRLVLQVVQRDPNSFDMEAHGLVSLPWER